MTLLFFPLLLFSQQEKKVGITGLHLNFKNIDPDFFYALEDSLTASFTGISYGEKYMLSIDANSRQMREIVKSWNMDTSSDVVDNELFNKTVLELEQVDLCIFLEISRFMISDKPAFYDTSAIEHEIFIELRILTIDCENRAIVEESIIESSTLKNDKIEDVKQQSIELTAKKFLNELNNSEYLSMGFAVEERKTLFVWIEGGYAQGIKREQFFYLFASDRIDTDSELFVKIVKVEENRSLGMILFDTTLPDEEMFEMKKMNKIGLELQINGGVLLSNLTATTMPLPMFSVRALIPVKLVFFRPVVQVEFNFIYQNNAVFMPFFFQTGGQGEINFNRFGMNLGFLIGAFFTPDENSSYNLDSLSLTPYYQLSVVLNKSIKLYTEVGYNFITINKFKETWNIDLSGIYINAGIALLL